MDIRSQRDMMNLYHSMKPKNGLRLYLHRHSVMDGIAILLADFQQKFLMSEATHSQLLLLDKHKIWQVTGDLAVDIWPIDDHSGFELNWLVKRIGMHLSSVDILEI